MEACDAFRANSGRIGTFYTILDTVFTSIGVVSILVGLASDIASVIGFV
jgi:hypothetical protein